ncbi:hypothetical protein GOB93_07500 [Acetobacter musti]|uniref:Uncharacterized protein n=1 Tax=Acetobacter musti TaxID=864732 RepID=A0ABX0JSB8_9PROT|nr:hypothetical protein [Acetobacter musti]NHN84489.1 hypothetical protein [Acetobacter musti]
MVQNATDYFTATTSQDFLDATNWSSGTLPTDYHEINISGTSTAPVTAVLGSTYSTEVPSLTIGDYGTLDITACDGSDATATPVFTADAMQIFANGNLTVDTASPVSLGINEISGTLTINNSSNVTLTTSRLSGDGNLVLNNATLGTESAGISVDLAMNVSLSGGSTLYTSGWAGGTVTFDPSTLNMIVLGSEGQNVTTAFKNVSANSEFALNGTDGVTPVSAQYSENSDGTYSLIITTSSNQTITLSDITAAAGYTPGSVSITKDLAGDYVIADSSLPASATTGWPPGHDHTSSCDNGSGGNSGDDNGSGSHCTPHHHHHDNSGSTSTHDHCHDDHGSASGHGCDSNTSWHKQSGSSGCAPAHQTSSGSGHGCDTQFWKEYAQDHFANCVKNWSHSSTTGTGGSCTHPDPWSSSHGSCQTVTAAGSHEATQWTNLLPTHCS